MISQGWSAKLCLFDKNKRKQRLSLIEMSWTLLPFCRAPLVCLCMWKDAKFGAYHSWFMASWAVSLWSWSTSIRRATRLLAVGGKWQKKSRKSEMTERKLTWIAWNVPLESLVGIIKTKDGTWIRDFVPVRRVELVIACENFSEQVLIVVFVIILIAFVIEGGVTRQPEEAERPGTIKASMIHALLFLHNLPFCPVLMTNILQAL